MVSKSNPTVCSASCIYGNHGEIINDKGVQHPFETEEFNIIKAYNNNSREGIRKENR